MSQSDRMDLEKAKNYIDGHTDLRKWCCGEPDHLAFCRGIVEGILSERQRMIEKFRPVVKKSEKVIREAQAVGLDHGSLAFELADLETSLSNFHELEEEINQ